MISAFEQYFTSLQGKWIAVLGLGVSNRPLVRLLLEYGCHVTGCDRTPREKVDAEVLELETLGCTLRLGDNYLDGVEADILFRTPGMHPGNPAIKALRSRGAAVTSEMEVFFEVCPCHLIAVTGSDGKTTTTTLISQLLKAVCDHQLLYHGPGSLCGFLCRGCGVRRKVWRQNSSGGAGAAGYGIRFGSALRCYRQMDTLMEESI